MCCDCDTSYIVSVHIQCQASIYTLSLCRGHSRRVWLAKQETLTPPGHLVSPLVCTGPWMSTVVFNYWCHSDSASVLLYLTFEFQTLFFEFPTLFFSWISKIIDGNSKNNLWISKNRVENSKNKVGNSKNNVLNSTFNLWNSKNDLWNSNFYLRISKNKVEKARTN